ncbi:MAG TPA: PAS domain S-box protein [Polyangiales bacterium]
MSESSEQTAATRTAVSAASALQASEDRFERLVASVLDYGIFMLDPKGHIVSWNAGAERINGYDADEIIGRHFSSFYPPEDVAGGKCERELETAAGRGRFEEEGWRVRKDGGRFWASVVITAMRDAGGELLGFAKVTRDLTERRRAQEELRRSDERLRLLIQSVKEYAIFMLDGEGRIATWNQGAQRLKGYAYEEIVGQHFSRFYPPEDVLAGKCEMELEVASRVGSFEDEGWRVRKDGSRFWANVVITAVRDADGKLMGFAKVTRDLSERKRHEEERVERARAEEARRLAEASEERQRALAASLRDARDKAEQVTRLKDEFLATVSHELRTPLSAILGWGRILQQGGLEHEKARHAIDAIVRNAMAQQQIVDDLLDVSRIISGKLRLDVDLVDINSVLTSAIDVVRPAADAKGVVLQPVLNPDAGLIKGDAARLQQVFWNLLTNAVKFTPRGGRVQISLRRVNSSVQIEVLDNGAGIDAEFLPHVFERFSQADSSRSRSRGGLGLGLSIVKHLIELHGGTVTAHSDGLGKGSVFAVRIPIVPVRSPIQQSEHRISHAPDVSYPAELSGLKVLVLDDEQDAREVVQLVLQQGGAHVTVASTVAEALEAVRTFRPDVVVSDIGLPEEDGYVFISKLRALSREDGGRTPAVALTAYARAEDRRRALVAGFQNHAAKPIEPQELVMVVANLAGRYR